MPFRRARVYRTSGLAVPAQLQFQMQFQFPLQLNIRAAILPQPLENVYLNSRRQCTGRHE